MLNIGRGHLRSVHVSQFRNIYTINAQDSLDATYPMYVHFNIADEMVKVVSVKLSFWLLPYRYYASTGISEENNLPTIGFQISKDNGVSYTDVLGQYTEDVSDLEIENYIDTSGDKIIKFTSSARARLSVQVTVKLDLCAR